MHSLFTSAAGYKPVSAAPMTYSTILRTRLFFFFVAIFVAIIAISMPAEAQTSRNFPVNAVRGNMAFKAPPMVEVDGKSERLATGVRIHSPQNMLVMSASMVNQAVVVNYRRENIGGQIIEVWILNPEEAAVKREKASTGATQ